MAEDTEASADPSMEEILASIRKIISDESPPVEAKSEAPEEDILELTQMVQDDGSIIDFQPIGEPEPEPVAPPPPSPVVATAPPAHFPSPPSLAPQAPLMSEPAASSAASALSSLASTVEIERLSSAPSLASYLGNGGRTLEDMVIELMRPLLKDWLDKNLPVVVDRLVQKEIERIARRS